MIRLYDGSRLVDLIFCVTTLLKILNGCCCYIDDKYRLGTVQGSYSFRSQLGCQPEFTNKSTGATRKQMPTTNDCSCIRARIKVNNHI